MFCYENNLVYPVYVSNKKFENCMDLLMITNVKKKDLIMCILRILTDLCAIKQEIRKEKIFASISYNVLVLIEF